MLISTLQNEVLPSPREAHQCKWTALANWKGGQEKTLRLTCYKKTETLT